MGTVGELGYRQMTMDVATDGRTIPARCRNLPLRQVPLSLSSADLHFRLHWPLTGKTVLFGAESNVTAASRQRLGRPARRSRRLARWRCGAVAVDPESVSCRQANVFDPAMATGRRDADSGEPVPGPTWRLQCASQGRLSGGGAVPAAMLHARNIDASVPALVRAREPFSTARYRQPAAGDAARCASARAIC